MNAADPAPGAGHPVSGDAGWARYGWVVPGVWLIFLAYPVAEVIAAGLGPGTTALALGLLVGFAAVYLACFHLHMGGRLPVPPARRWRWIGLAVLVAITALLWWLLGLPALNLSPFLVAYGAHLFPPRTAWLVGSATIVVVTLAVWRFDPDLLVFVMVLVGVFAVNLAIARVAAAGDREEAVRRQLAVISERERVARDVHDGLGHALTVIALKAELAERLWDADPGRARDELGELHRLTRDALAEVRATVGGLRSGDLTTTVAALELTLGGAGFKVHLDGDPADVAASRELDRALCWVLREAVTNVLTHSGGRACSLRFAPRLVAVADDGVGVGGGAHRDGHGIRGMSERLAPLGATVAVEPGPTGGTQVRVTW